MYIYVLPSERLNKQTNNQNSENKQRVPLETEVRNKLLKD